MSLCLGHSPKNVVLTVIADNKHTKEKIITSSVPHKRRILIFCPEIESHKTRTLHAMTSNSLAVTTHHCASGGYNIVFLEGDAFIVDWVEQLRVLRTFFANQVPLVLSSLLGNSPARYHLA